MKKTTIFMILAQLISIFMFLSCDSLWSVGETTNISFNLNLDKYFNASANSDTRSIGVVPGGNAFDDLFNNPDVYVLVSLHNSHDDSVIASQRLSLQEAQNTNVAFDGIRMRTELYAKIEVNNPYDDGSDVPFVFRARTLNAIVKGTRIELIAKPNVVFYESNGVSYVKGDSSYPINGPNYDEDHLNSIIRPNASVLSDIYDFMKVDGTLLPDATVYIIGTMEVSNGNEIWDFDGLTLTRPSSDNTLVRVTDGASLTLNNITLDGNNNSVSITAVEVEDFATLTMNDGSVIKNNQNIQLGGGGVYVNGATFTMNGGIIHANAGSSGGGVYVGGGTFTMNGGYISDNSQGVFVSDSDFTLNGGSITGNEGRGILVYDGNVRISGGTISNNNGGNGGGVYFSSSNEAKSFEMSGGVIRDNTASDFYNTAKGGGVYIKEGTFIMSGTATIAKNKSSFGGGVYLENGTFLVESGKIDSNTVSVNGGGVYINGGAFTMKTGSINNNSISATYEAEGGGVYINNGVFIMEDGSIDNNTVSANIINANGGGVYLNNGEFTMKNGSITGNSASSPSGDSVNASKGGGLYINNATFNMQGGILSDNKVFSPTDSYSMYGYSGGGVYVHYESSISSYGTINLQGSARIIDNTLGNTRSNISYVSSDDSLTINVVEMLEPTACFGLSPIYLQNNLLLVNGPANFDLENFFLDDHDTAYILRKYGNELSASGS